MHKSPSISTMHVFFLGYSSSDRAAYINTDVVNASGFVFRQEVRNGTFLAERMQKLQQEAGALTETKKTKSETKVVDW